MSSTAIDEIPIMIPSDTPSTTYENEVHFTTPPSLPADNDNDELIEALLEPDEICLTTNDIQSDPILSSLAKHQSQAKKQQPNLPTGSEMKQKVPFKARPAPPSTRAEGLGPRMTKSVALRLGMKWDDPKAYRQAGTGQEEGHDQAGGHKRAQSSTPIASLASPSLTPRPTKSSQLRTGEISSPVVRRDPAVIAAANKVKAQEEKERRRKSLALPTSLSAPQIAPRGNRTTQLRNAVPPSSFKSALGDTSVINLGTPKLETVKVEKGGLNRRASIAGTVKSLAAPSITPRSNKAAMLRAPPTGPLPSPAMSNAGSIRSPNTAALSRPKMAKAPSSMSVKTTSTAGAGAGAGTGALSPRPTKASLLRAELGAKVVTQQTF